MGVLHPTKDSHLLPRGQGHIRCPGRGVGAVRLGHIPVGDSVEAHGAPVQRLLPVELRAARAALAQRVIGMVTGHIQSIVICIGRLDDMGQIPALAGELVLVEISPVPDGDPDDALPVGVAFEISDRFGIISQDQEGVTGASVISAAGVGGGPHISAAPYARVPEELIGQRGQSTGHHHPGMGEGIAMAHPLIEQLIVSGVGIDVALPAGDPVAGGVAPDIELGVLVHDVAQRHGDLIGIAAVGVDVDITGEDPVQSVRQRRDPGELRAGDLGRRGDGRRRQTGDRQRDHRDQRQQTGQPPAERNMCVGHEVLLIKTSVYTVIISDLPQICQETTTSNKVSSPPHF